MKATVFNCEVRAQLKERERSLKAAEGHDEIGLALDVRVRKSANLIYILKRVVCEEDFSFF